MITCGRSEPAADATPGTVRGPDDEIVASTAELQPQPRQHAASRRGPTAGKCRSMQPCRALFRRREESGEDRPSAQPERADGYRDRVVVIGCQSSVHDTRGRCRRARLRQARRTSRLRCRPNLPRPVSDKMDVAQASNQVRPAKRGAAGPALRRTRTLPSRSCRSSTVGRRTHHVRRSHAIQQGRCRRVGRRDHEEHPERRGRPKNPRAKSIARGQHPVGDTSLRIAVSFRSHFLNR